MKYIIAKGKDEQTNILQWHPESQILVEMSPHQFLNLTPTAIFEDNLQGRSLQIIKYLQRRLMAELSIDVPFLDLDIKTCEVQNHEGRHRAYASYLVGLKKIPVIIYLRNGFRYVHKNEVNIGKICKRIKSQKCSLRDKSNYEIIF